MFEINTLEFGKMFMQKKKLFKFATKNALFGYFCAAILKKQLSYMESSKTKHFKLWYQNCLILAFLEWNLKKKLPCFKEAPFNFSKCKFSCETTRIHVWDQKNFLWVFLDYNFEKATVIFEFSTFESFETQSFGLIFLRKLKCSTENVLSACVLGCILRIYSCISNK